MSGAWKQKWPSLPPRQRGPGELWGEPNCPPSASTVWLNRAAPFSGLAGIQPRQPAAADDIQPP